MLHLLWPHHVFLYRSYSANATILIELSSSLSALAPFILKSPQTLNLLSYAQTLSKLITWYMRQMPAIITNSTLEFATPLPVWTQTKAEIITRRFPN